VPLEHIQRQILADKPRVTKFPISWGDEASNNQTVAQSPAGHAMMDAAMAATGTPAVGSASTVTPPGPTQQQDNASGVVFMQEESNMDHPHFGGSGGVQAMNE
jgi:hypothetical protein